jgi:hypothetical protein
MQGELIGHFFPLLSVGSCVILLQESSGPSAGGVEGNGRGPWAGALGGSLRDGQGPVLWLLAVIQSFFFIVFRPGGSCRKNFFLLRR